MGLIGLLVGGAMDAHKAIKQNQAKNDEGTHHVVVDNRFSIDIPSFLSERHDLSEDASVQYGSRTLDIAYQVIDEPKDEFIQALKEIEEHVPFDSDKTLLDKMAIISLGNYYEDLDKVEIGDYTETTINGLKAVTLYAFQQRTFFKDALYGSFAFIEGKKTMYQIIILSGGTSISKLAEKLEESIQSFREL
ncbi:MAG: hypothetical protein IJQ84_00330 [Paludibacteraceae bacterium]|nr:hypothetical protein [Paludibacteraceae bacterium]